MFVSSTSLVHEGIFRSPRERVRGYAACFFLLTGVIISSSGCSGIHSTPLEKDGGPDQSDGVDTQDNNPESSGDEETTVLSWVEVEKPDTPELQALWAGGHDCVWVVGELGTILKWNGSSWNKQDSPTTYDLFDVWALDCDHAWAVGDQATLLQWNGSEWTKQDDVIEYARSFGNANPLTSVSGTSGNDLWILVGGRVDFVDGSVSGFAILHYDGSGWAQIELPDVDLAWTASRVFALAPDDIWVVMDSPDVFRYNGSYFINHAAEVSGNLAFCDIWGDRADNVWLAGEKNIDPLILASKESGWQVLPTPDFRPKTIWGQAGGPVWIAGSSYRVLRYEGGRWVPENVARGHSTFRTLGGIPEGQLWGIVEPDIIVRRVTP